MRARSRRAVATTSAMGSAVGAAAIATVIAASSPAAAEVVASQGFFTEAGIGATAFVGKAAPHSAIGPSITARLGRDLFSWLSVGGYLGASIHEATVPPPPEGEYYQLYRAGGDARLGLALGRVGIFAEGGLGLALMSSNVLDRVEVTEPGERFSVTFHGGVGAEYQIENRHYTFGVAVDGWLYTQYARAVAVESRLYLRYTY